MKILKWKHGKQLSLFFVENLKVLAVLIQNENIPEADVLPLRDPRVLQLRDLARPEHLPAGLRNHGPVVYAEPAARCSTVLSRLELGRCVPAVSEASCSVRTAATVLSESLVLLARRGSGQKQSDVRIGSPSTTRAWMAPRGDDVIETATHRSSVANSLAPLSLHITPIISCRRKLPWQGEENSALESRHRCTLSPAAQWTITPVTTGVVLVFSCFNCNIVVLVAGNNSALQLKLQSKVIHVKVLN